MHGEARVNEGAIIEVSIGEWAIVGKWVTIGHGFHISLMAQRLVMEHHLDENAHRPIRLGRLKVQ